MNANNAIYYNDYAERINIINLLQQVEGQALTVSQICEVTGLNKAEVQQEVKRLVNSGRNIGYRKGVIFIPASNRKFNEYLVVALVASLFTTILIKLIIG